MSSLHPFQLFSHNFLLHISSFQPFFSSPEAYSFRSKVSSHCCRYSSWYPNLFSFLHHIKVTAKLQKKKEKKKTEGRKTWQCAWHQSARRTKLKWQALNSSPVTIFLNSYTLWCEMTVFYCVTFDTSTLAFGINENALRLELLFLLLFDSLVVYCRLLTTWELALIHGQSL